MTTTPTCPLLTTVGLVNKIDECLDLLERCRDNDPYHDSWYMAAKESLQEAAGLCEHCILD